MSLESVTINSEDGNTSDSLVPIEASGVQDAKEQPESSIPRSLNSIARSITVAILFYVADTLLLPLLQSLGMPHWVVPILSAGIPTIIALLLFIGYPGKRGVFYYFIGVGLFVILAISAFPAYPALQYGIAAKIGLPAAQTSLAVTYLNQGDSPEITGRAVGLLESAAAKGDRRAMIQLGNLYLTGRQGLPQNTNLAIEWLTTPSAEGDALALAYLGRCYLIDSKDANFNPIEAERLLKRSVDMGDPHGCYYLGDLYAKGVAGVAKNEAEAARLYEKAGDLPAAMRSLSLCKLNGVGTNKDIIQAVTLMKKAAEEGDDASALCYLGLWQLNGENGLVVNEIEAVRLFERSASKGYAPAHFNLGYCYENGKGIEKNLKEAFEEYIRGASDGNINSMKAVARFYINGIQSEDGQPEYEKAIPFLEEAAGAGDSEAMYSLAICYLNAGSSEGDLVDKGNEWMKKAAELDNNQAKEYLSTQTEKP